MIRVFVFLLALHVQIVSAQENLNSNELKRSDKLPIKSERLITFNTDEGSFMSVDVSPDGKTLVFDLLGDLYTVPVTGGNATQLTQGIALNVRPIWSPDGNQIAYISDNSGDFCLHVLDVIKKSNYNLGSIGDVFRKKAIWSSNGNFIKFDKYIYSLVGGKVPVPRRFINIIRFSNDGNALYYVDSSIRISKYNLTSKTSEIVSARLKGFTGGGEISLSSDLHWCAYISEYNNSKKLIIKNLLDSTSRIIGAPFMFLKDSLYNNYIATHFAFSPDNKNIFIACNGKIHKINVETGLDQIIAFNAKVKIGLGRLNYNTFRIKDDFLKVRYTRSANLAPDRKKLVFTALNKIYVMDLPGGQPRIIAHQSVGQFQPAFSPDGKWIAYVSWSDTAGGFLWRVPSLGGQPEQLTKEAGFYQRPTWLPDGSGIAVIKGLRELIKLDGNGFGPLQVVYVNGKGIKIIDTVPLHNWISFSNDGENIIYRSFKNDTTKEMLVSRNISNGFCEVLAMGSVLQGSFQYYPSEMSISPDERFIVYSMGEDLHLLPVCKMIQSNILTEKNDVSKISVIRFSKGIDHYWDRKGKYLNWSYGDKFYSIEPSKIILTARKAMQGKLSLDSSEGIINVDVTPDRVVSMNVTVPRYTAKGTLVLSNVRIITMRKDEIIENGVVVIKNNRLVAVGKSNTVSIPLGAKVINLSGCTIMPGLVDLHLHFKTPQDIFPQQSWALMANLAYGVTTARNPSSNFDSFGYSELVETGQMVGPRFYSAGERVERFSFMGVRCNSFSDASRIAKKRKELGGTIVKQYRQPTRIQRQWLLLASKEAGLNMTNEGAEDPIFDIGMIKDGNTGIEHNPIWGNVYKDVTTLFAKSGTFLTPTLQVGYEKYAAKSYLINKYWYVNDEKLNRFWHQEISIMHRPPYSTNFLLPAKVDAIIRKQGGKVTMGSHGNWPGIGSHNELWALQMGGLSNMEALQAGTILAAEGLGIQGDIGSIEPGKIADLIILNKNPLDDIHNTREIRYVMKSGILYEGDTLDVIWPVAKKGS